MTIPPPPPQGAVRFVSGNLFNYGLPSAQWPEGPALEMHKKRQAELIVALQPHVFAGQEFRGPDAEVAGARLRELAEATGMDCHVEPPLGGTAGTVAVASGDSDFAVGLMWRPGITPVPGTWWGLGRRNGRLWHSGASLVLTVFGVAIRFVAFHGSPFNPNARFEDLYQLILMLNDDEFPGLGGMDGNMLGGSRISLPWSARWWRPWQATTWYDPDPFRRMDWYPRLLFQLDPTSRRQRGDRRAGQLLVSPRFGRLHDLAVVAGVPYTPTTGGHPDDPHPPRRPDQIYGTRHFAAPGAVLAFYTVDTGEDSDHDWVVVDVLPDAVQRSLR